jgi:uncharacterized membrane protein YccC
MGDNQILTIVGTNIALILASLGTTITLFLWSRSESSLDRRQWQDEIRQDRRDILSLIQGIQEEIKDFHIRLAERRKDDAKRD